MAHTITYYTRKNDSGLPVYGATLGNGSSSTRFEMDPGKTPADLGRLMQPAYRDCGDVRFYNSCFCMDERARQDGHMPLTLGEAVEFRTALKGVQDGNAVPEEHAVLVMVKPWSLASAADIMSVLGLHGSREVVSKVDSVPAELVERMYAKHKDAPFFEAMVEDHAGKPAIIAVYRGNIEEFAIVKPWAREMFGESVPQPCVSSDLGYHRDAFHCSASEEEARLDLHIWHQYISDAR